jgi:hypothetical protein
VVTYKLSDNMVNFEDEWETKETLKGTTHVSAIGFSGVLNDAGVRWFPSEALTGL